MTEYTGKRIMVSGGFDPLHGGHVALIQAAAAYGEVVVALNSDEWLHAKKGYALMPWAERSVVLRGLRGVVDVIPVNDSDGTVCAALQQYCPHYFGNGGDRVEDNTPELQVCRELGVVPVFVLGGGKIASSSVLVRGLPFARDFEKRPWGWFFTLLEEPGKKIKILCIAPGRRTSLQSHAHRTEYLQSISGNPEIQYGDREWEGLESGIAVFTGHRHRLRNVGTEPAYVLEWQGGEECSELDITRYEDDYGRLCV